MMPDIIEQGRAGGVQGTGDLDSGGGVVLDPADEDDQNADAYGAGRPRQEGVRGRTSGDRSDRPV